MTELVLTLVIVIVLEDKLKSQKTKSINPQMAPVLAAKGNYLNTIQLK
jgi:hypothetical protein